MADTGGANATATVPTWSRPRGDAYRPACDAVAKDRTRSVSVTTACTHPADGQAWAVVSSGSGTSKPARDSARTTPHAVDGDRGALPVTDATNGAALPLEGVATVAGAPM
jgi:hypothetical protein